MGNSHLKHIFKTPRNAIENFNALIFFYSIHLNRVRAFKETLESPSSTKLHGNVDIGVSSKYVFLSDQEWTRIFLHFLPEPFHDGDFAEDNFFSHFILLLIV